MAFPARYAGLCDSCGDAYDHGDSISYMDGFDKPVCEDCTIGRADLSGVLAGPRGRMFLMDEREIISEQVSLEHEENGLLYQLMVDVDLTHFWEKVDEYIEVDGIMPVYCDMSTGMVEINVPAVTLRKWKEQRHSLVSYRYI